MREKTISGKITLAITTVFGLGHTPLMPGTTACIAAVLFFLIIKSSINFFIFTVFSIVLSFLFSGKAEKIFGEKDCKKIVIDDFSGMLITFLFVPRNIDFIYIVIGFFLFRMLDMLKIPPADKIEKIKGSLGVVGDDVIAGIYACFILNIVRILG